MERAAPSDRPFRPEEGLRYVLRSVWPERAPLSPRPATPSSANVPNIAAAPMAKSPQLNPSDGAARRPGPIVRTGVDFPCDLAYWYHVSTGPYGDFDVARSPIEPNPSGADAEVVSDLAYWYQVSTGPYRGLEVARSPSEPNPSGAAAEAETDRAYEYQVSTEPYGDLDVARSPIEPKPSGATTIRGFDVARSPSSPLAAADGTTTAPTARARAVTVIVRLSVMSESISSSFPSTACRDRRSASQDAANPAALPIGERAARPLCQLGDTRLGRSAGGGMGRRPRP